MVYDYFDNITGETVSCELVTHHKYFIKLESYDKKKNYYLAYFTNDVVVLLRHYATNCYKVLDVQFI